MERNRSKIKKKRKSSSFLSFFLSFASFLAGTRNFWLGDCKSEKKEKKKEKNTPFVKRPAVLGREKRTNPRKKKNKKKIEEEEEEEEMKMKMEEERASLFDLANEPLFDIRLRERERERRTSRPKFPRAANDFHRSGRFCAVAAALRSNAARLGGRYRVSRSFTEFRAPRSESWPTIADRIGNDLKLCRF